MITRYDLGYYALTPLAAPYLAYRSLTRRKYRESARGMLGLDLPIGNNRKQWKAGSIWIHAVSVGEVVAAYSIAPLLKKRFPRLPILVTTVTETGQAHAHKIVKEATAIHYFPLDFSWNVQRFLRCFRPKLVILMETEIWPNFLTLSRRQGAEVFMVNGKLSEGSFKGYSFGRSLLAPAFQAFRAFCMQTESDAERMRELSRRPEDVYVTGNCKFDAVMEPLDDDVARLVKINYKLGQEDRPTLVVGSTHPGEEEIFLNVYRRLRERFPTMRLILSPRHPERFHEVYEMFRRQEADWRVSRASLPRQADPDVFILDKMGELARMYGLGDVAVVAGSFCPVGGHNVLEAAIHAIPVVVGPDMHSQKELDRLFRSEESGLVRCTAENVAEKLTELFQDQGLREKIGKQALDTSRKNQGSAKRSLEIIEKYVSGLEL
ncbi:MAG: 3-deoxy-D-manno-octulosonic acid transferase [Candidatus Sumerlaeia bacterium]